MTDPLPLRPLPLRRRTARTGADLAAAGVIAAERIAEIDAVAARYSVAVTPALLDAMNPGNPADPVALQFLPDTRELTATSAELVDPIGDDAHSPVKGVVHRYPDRVLLTPILHCPLYCRFCFRREKVGGEEAVLNAADLTAALDYIRAHSEIWEVILTGGDPLMLPVAQLKSLLAELDAIPHVQTIRLHSRVPIGDPDRIGPPLLDALSIETALWVAVHCNHAQELTALAEAACRRLSKAGIPLVSQTVLLKGVNDDPMGMEQLMRALVRNRIKPYYLHHLDLAPGTQHFRTSIATGQEIMRHLRGRASGLCQPGYVLDIPGGHGKAPIGPVYLQVRDENQEADWQIEDWQGTRHAYTDHGNDQ